MMVNVAPRTPVLRFKKYEEMGYAAGDYFLISLTATYADINGKLGRLKKDGITQTGTHGGVPFEEFIDFL